jgi:hypothetical protein
MDAAAKKLLPNRPEVTRGEWQWPGSVSIDAGRDARADIELWRMGLTTAAEMYGEAGHDWQSSMRQRAKEAAYIRELAEEMKVASKDISSGVESVATDPNLAPIESSIDRSVVSLPEGGGITADQLTMNGAQVGALVELSQLVASGIITREVAKSIARAAFPLITQEAINQIFDGISPGEFTPEEVKQRTDGVNYSAKKSAVKLKRRKKT